MSIPLKSHCALILPGAVAKGAYEAGVIEVLAEKNTRIDRIVATSSGALNAVAYAAGIRSGHEKKMAERLVNAWVENGGWYDSLSFTPLHWLKGRGLSDHHGILERLNSLIAPCTHSAKRDVELRIIVAPLNGVPSNIGATSATTYEQVIHFSGKDFDTAEGLARIFKVTTAACSFPGLFVPVDIEGLGPCVDGGTVNNAPVKYALDENDVSHIIVPVPFPTTMESRPSLRGLGLMNHMIEILINERLFRDLKDAQMVNDEISKLERLVVSGVLTREQADKVKSTLQIRTVKISEVRPAQILKGNSFSGFFNKGERARLVDEGRKAALKYVQNHPTEYKRDAS